MNKILVGIPVLYGAQHCRASVLSVIDEADVLIVENGATDDVKKALKDIDCHRITNPANIYVNPAWNQIIQFFMNHGEYDTLIIMNSDFIMSPGWSNQLSEIDCCIPSDGNYSIDTEVFAGTPGVFIHLSRQWCKMVYQIPESIKVWFGDNWIYDNLRARGIKTVVKCGLVGTHFHNGSQTIQRVPGISELIEQDKIAWEEIMRETVKK